MSRDHAGRYTGPAIFFHWAIATLMLANVGLAWSADLLGDAGRRMLIPVHVSIGLTVLLLVPLRLAWRRLNAPPALPPVLAHWEAWLAHFVHGGLYLAMLALPISGWIFLSANRLSLTLQIRWFGLFVWPTIGPIAHLPAEQKAAWHTVFVDIHQVVAYLLYLLFVLHIAGLLKHRLYDRHDVLWRMLPWGRRPG